MHLLILIPAVAIVSAILFIYYLTRYVNNEPHFVETSFDVYQQLICMIDKAKSLDELADVSTYASQTMEYWGYDADSRERFNDIVSRIDNKTFELNRLELFSAN
jgi:hypothetical protein